MARPTVVVVDPIFRGSRLFYSSMAVEAAADAGADVHLLSRTGAETDHSIEMMAGRQFQLHEVVPVADDFWYGRIGREGVRRLLDALLELKDRGAEAVYFAGLNECYPDVFDLLLEERYRPLRELRMLLVEYHPQYLLKTRKRVFAGRALGAARQWLRFQREARNKRGLLKRVMRSFPALRLAVLDERVVNRQWRGYLGSTLRRGIEYLPDPGPHTGGDQDRLAPAGRRLRVLLIGRQSRRKGLPEFLRALETGAGLCDRIEFRLVGELEAELEPFRKRLQRQAACVSWEEAYVPEDRLDKIYRWADYVLLPYVTAFNASSGVLAYATSFGVPVISGEHGLVGFRIRENGLGVTYRAGKGAGLRKCLQTLPAPGSPQYQRFVSGCQDFAGSRSIPEHEKVLVSAVFQAGDS